MFALETGTGFRNAVTQAAVQSSGGRASADSWCWVRDLQKMALNGHARPTLDAVVSGESFWWVVSSGQSL